MTQIKRLFEQATPEESGNSFQVNNPILPKEIWKEILNIILRTNPYHIILTINLIAIFTKLIANKIAQELLSEYYGDTVKNLLIFTKAKTYSAAFFRLAKHESHRLSIHNVEKNALSLKNRFEEDFSNWEFCQQSQSLKEVNIIDYSFSEAKKIKSRLMKESVRFVDEPHLFNQHEIKGNLKILKINICRDSFSLDALDSSLSSFISSMIFSRSFEKLNALCFMLKPLGNISLERIIDEIYFQAMDIYKKPSELIELLCAVPIDLGQPRFYPPKEKFLPLTKFYGCQKYKNTKLISHIESIMDEDLAQSPASKKCKL